MAIDPEFEETYDEAERHEGHRVWTPDGDDPTEEVQGIHGTHVAVDFDLCIADGETGHAPPGCTPHSLVVR